MPAKVRITVDEFSSSYVEVSRPGQEKPEVLAPGMSTSGVLGQFELAEHKPPEGERPRATDPLPNNEFSAKLPRAGGETIQTLDDQTGGIIEREIGVDQAVEASARGRPLDSSPEPGKETRRSA